MPADNLAFFEEKIEILKETKNPEIIRLIEEYKKNPTDKDVRSLLNDSLSDYWQYLLS